MKNISAFILIFISLYFQLRVSGQDMGYHIENDSIHFKFDVRLNKTYSLDEKAKLIKAENIDIQTVTLAGEFNDWSKNKWHLKKLNDYVYKLSKSLDDFDYDHSAEFKYVINEKYWAEPEENFINSVTAYDKFSSYLNSKNLRLYSAMPSTAWNVNFSLEGFKNADEIIVTGSFNSWNEKAFKMQNTEFGWNLKMKVKPGEYQYKFIVDGNWISDPSNPHQVSNEYGGYNSVMNVKTAVTFTL